MSYTKIFTNTSIIVKGLCNLLEDASIHYVVKDRFESSKLAGFGETINSVEVHVLDNDIEEAKKFVESYKSEINS
ncbi:MAG: DUF2007 domain-containing protein [Flavobacteriaceae bacterium]|nr:DUF2007 domain-containing protein [Flavobacteriaceae bacterium]